MRPAAILRRSEVRALLEAKRSPSVIEYGAGALRNALYLQRLGCDVTVVELEETRARFRSSYDRFVSRGGTVVLTKQATRSARVPRYAFDLALMTFVLETVCDPRARKRLLEDCRDRLKERGALVLSARGGGDVITGNRAGVRCSDGFITPQSSFVRSLSPTVIAGLLRAAKFEEVRFLQRYSSSTPRIVHVIATFRPG